MPNNEMQWSSATPGLLIFLIDQSGSMLQPYECGENRTQFATKAINRMIDNIIQTNFNGDKPKNRCFITVIGYNHNVNVLTSGYLQDLDSNPIRIDLVKKKTLDGAGGVLEIDEKMPVWFDPITQDGATNMTGALRSAKDIVEKWVSDYPERPAPVIINVSDGNPYYEGKDISTCMQEAIEIANGIKAINTVDGKVQIFNAMIGDGPKAKFPTTKDVLITDEAKFLFEISTVIPDAYYPAAEKKGLCLSQGARGCICQCDAIELIQLIDFGSSKGLATKDI